MNMIIVDIYTAQLVFSFNPNQQSTAVSKSDVDLEVETKVVYEVKEGVSKMETRDKCSHHGTCFTAYGRFCASHPWKVIISTITIMACMLLSKSRQVFSERDTDLLSSLPQEKTTTYLIIINSLAIIYVYYQFMSLRNAGSSVAAVFMLVIGFASSTGVLCIVDFKTTILLNESFPFFLLLTDVSWAVTLARYATNAKSKEEICVKISQGLSVLAPAHTLDTLVQVLIFSIGTISGVRRLETICYFACVSLVANYLVFMTCLPASLALLVEICPSYGTRFTSDISFAVTSSDHINPVAQRVKVVMSVGLIVTHVLKRLISGVAPLFPLSAPSSSIERVNNTCSTPDITILFLSTDQLVTIGLAIMLLLKYILYNRTNRNTHSNYSPYIVSSSCPLNNPPTVDTTSSIRPSSLEYCSTQRWSYASTQTNTRSNSVPAANSLAISPSEDSECNNGLKVPLLRTVEKCIEIYRSEIGCSVLSDEEIVSLIEVKQIRLHSLEETVKDPYRSVVIRRKFIQKLLASENILNGIPFQDYDYQKLIGKSCENVIGYVPVPVGMAGPLLLNGKEYHVPMATTEKYLIEYVTRGCNAVSMCGGVNSIVYDDGMTRAPVIKLPSAGKACDLKRWLDEPDNFKILESVFNSTSNYARLISTCTTTAGRLLFIRFKATTRDAMGMNMVTKGVEECLNHLKGLFADVDVISLSGNYCTDKKPSAVNWINGRGKSVVCDAVIPADVIENVLHTNVDSLIEINTNKNLIGSAMAGSVGGVNAQAANVVSAIFIATGQDPAQVVGSSNCITVLEREGATDVYISCTMPSIEVGTYGGGTELPAQSSCLKLLGVDGRSSRDTPEHNPTELARIICGAVLAGEVSLLSELASSDMTI